MSSVPHPTRRVALLFTSLVFLVMFISSVQALPLETFTTPFSLSCGEGQRECSGVLRVQTALGRHTGVLISKGSGGEVTVRTGTGRGIVRVEADDVADVAVVFSWDGDSNPEVLSGSGLNCFDLTRAGAYAFIISKMAAEASCIERPFIPGCPTFTVQSRVYDSRDPTGQRFSESTILQRDLQERDLVIPFSNFVRSGPRGKGSFTCAGGVTIALKFSGLEELDLRLGSIYTNGNEMLTPSPVGSIGAGAITPTATIIPALATVSPTVAATPPSEQSAATSPSQAVTPSLTIGDTGVSSPDQREKPASHMGTSEETPVVATVRPAKRIDEPAESVYGSVVIGQ